MKDIEKFLQTARQMRSAQKEYFRTRSSIALNEAKKLEKEFDEMLPGDREPSRTSTQPKLF